MQRRAHDGLGALVLGLVACGGDPGGGPQSGSAGNDGPSSGATDDGRTTGTPEDTGPPGTTSLDDGPMTGPTTLPDPVCGNGILEDIEECDDGNAIDGDGCDADCTLNLDTLEWQVLHAGDAMIAESGQGIAVDGAGNIVVGGFEVDAVGDPNMWLAKYDPAGAELWAMTFDPSGGLDDRIYGVAIDPDDNILVTGDVDVMPAASDIWVAKLDPQGTELWSRTFDGPIMGDDGGRGVASDSAGNVAVTGFVRVSNADLDIFVAKLDPAGTTQWSEVVMGPEALDDRGQGVAVTAEDEVVVAGYVSHGGFDRDLWLRKYDADGDDLWTETWDDGNNGENTGFGVAIRPDGMIAVAGMTPIIATNQDVFLGLWDADGALQWYKRFGGQAYLHDNGLAVTSDADSNLVVAGFRGATETDSDIWLRKYDAAGNAVWSQVVVGRAGDRDQATAVATDAEGNILVTGEIRTTGNDGDVWIAKLGPG
jgi:uncharacterized delta-60 repeat protein